MRQFSYLLIILFIASCSEKRLEISPTDRLNDLTVWNDPASVNLFLNEVYNSVNAGPYPAVSREAPSEISNDPLDDFTDNSTYGPEAGLPSAQMFNNASYGPGAQLFPNQWKYMYANIRKCNLLIEKLSNSSFDETIKKIWLRKGVSLGRIFINNSLIYMVAFLLLPKY